MGHDQDTLQAKLQVCVLDLFGLDAQVVERLPLGRVVEHHHQFWDWRVQLSPLMVAEGLPEGMTAVVPLDVDPGAP